MRFPKQVVWKLLSILPVSLVKQVLQRTVGPRYIEAVVRNKQSRLAVDLQVQQILADARETEWNGVLLIGGVARIGKSMISDKLAEHVGASVVRMDKIRYCYEGLLDSEERMRAKTHLLDQLCEKGSGLIIEGDDLIRRCTVRQQFGDELMHDASNLIQDKEAGSQMGVELIRRLSARHGAIGVVLGASQDRPRDKARAILSSSDDRTCWAIKHLNEEEIRKLSQAIIVVSEALSQDADRYGVTYFDVISSDFETSVDAIISNILAMAAGEHLPTGWSS